jgi:hypothetical protein
MSLRDAAGWAGMLGLTSLSNPAVKYRFDKSADFLEALTDHLLAASAVDFSSAVCHPYIAGPRPIPQFRQHAEFVVAPADDTARQGCYDRRLWDASPRYSRQ